MQFRPIWDTLYAYSANHKLFKRYLILIALSMTHFQKIEKLILKYVGGFDLRDTIKTNIRHQQAETKISVQRRTIPSR